MKILLSAYSCGPARGSEVGIGWHWAEELSRLGHEVWVLTCGNPPFGSDRPDIESALSEDPTLSNLHFIFHDLPSWLKLWRKPERGIRLHYFLWQWWAYRLAREINKDIAFDLVQHITFGSIRQPSYMGKLGIPFIFGPVGGGETCPWSLRKGYGWRGWILDAVRDLWNFSIQFDPLMRSTFRHAKTIYVKTLESRRVIPRRYRSKVVCQLELGVDPQVINRTEPVVGNIDSEFRVLFVGRFLYWKGMHLGLSAFANLMDNYPAARLSMVGQGPNENRWRRLAAGLQISNQIDWYPWVDPSELKEIYAKHHVLLFPSLHDSSGNVVLEAFTHGLSVVCLKLGGPGGLVNDSCGRVVPATGCSEKEVVLALTQALKEIADSDSLRQALRKGALVRAEEFSWSKVVGGVYQPAHAN